MKLSNNFTLRELTYSTTAEKKGIENKFDDKVVDNLERLCKEILQPIREAYGHSITINSGYRCNALNKAVGGATTSQHLLGEAVDISCSATSKAMLFNLIHNMIKSGKLKVGQLIWEYGTKKEPNWIHLSLPRTNKPNNQVLYLYSK